MLKNIKTYKITIVFLSIFSFFTSCTEETTIINSIRINTINNDTIYSGKEYQLKVNTTPSSDEIPRLSWSVSDPTIATIQFGGVLKPIKKGEITVYVNSLQSGEKKVSDSHKFVILNSGIFLKDKTITINPLEIKKLEYEFLPKGFKSESEISWISKDPEVASVDQEGNVKGIQNGKTTITARIGNPLTGFYSESSCSVTVSTFTEPIYSYENGILIFEQKVPGLLPMIARKIAYFKKIILKGPINGDDMLFFIENSSKIEFLDLGQSYAVKGGRKLKAIPYKDYEEYTYSIDNDFIPYMYWSKLKIKNLVVPQNLTSAFSFGRPKSRFSLDDTETEFPMEYLEFPNTYNEIELINGIIKKIKIPENLQKLTCNVFALNLKDSPFTKLVFEEKITLPNNLKSLIAINTVFEKELIIPSSVDEVKLLSEQSELIFEPNSTIQITSEFVPKMKKSGTTKLFKTSKIVFPEGIKTIGKKSLGTFFSGSHRDQEYGNTLKHIVFPSTLKKIEYGAFYYAEIEKPIKLPSELNIIEYSAFQFSSISEVFIPASITKIGSYAFADCPRLEEVHIANPNPEVIEKDVFKRDKKLGKIDKIYVPQGSKQNYIDAGYNNYFFQIIEE